MSRDRDSGKRRSFGQRVGLYGENAFRLFAERQGLIATKVEEDYGIDFLCQVDLDPGTLGSSSIADTFIGACVRATRRGDGAVQLYRADAQYLLRSRAILVFVLIHVVEDERRAYYRFVDREFAWRLATFHRSGRTKMSVKLSDCRTEHGFRKDLIQALQPGFVEGVSLSLAEQGLKQLIAGATVEIQRGANGQLTLATALNFFDYFERLTEDEQQSLYEAAFGVPQFQQRRLGELALREGLVENLSQLPPPYVLTGFVVDERVELVVSGPAGRSTCAFRHTSNGPHFGYVHTGGLSLTISKSKLVDGMLVHEMQTYLDPDVETDRHDFPSLFAFLEHCVPESMIRVQESDFELEIEYFHGLVVAGEFARKWRQAEGLTGWHPGLVWLRDASDVETFTTVAFLGQLADDPSFLNGFGFTIEKGEARDLSTYRQKQRTCILPVVANTASATVVAELNTQVTTFSDEDLITGLRVDEVHDVAIESRPRQEKTTTDPELLVDPSWPSFAFGSGRVRTTTTPSGTR